MYVTVHNSLKLLMAIMCNMQCSAGMGIEGNGNVRNHFQSISRLDFLLRSLWISDREYS